MFTQGLYDTEVSKAPGAAAGEHKRSFKHNSIFLFAANYR